LKPRIPSWLKAALAVVILVVAAVGSWRLLGPKPGPYTIAVLPLKNLSPELGSDYFSDGLTDEIISNLSVIDGLEVKSQTSSFYFKDKPRDIHSIGAQLGAKMILEGSVLRAGDKLRVNVQLVRVSDDYPLWSGRFERELKDIFAVQDEISRSVVNELRLKFGRGQRRYNTNLEAYDLYLKARALSNQYPSPSNQYPSPSLAALTTSIPLFEAAISKDPNFAPAYAGIADAYAYRSMTPRALSPEIAYPKMKEACEKALQLDPLLAEAHACMGLIHTRDQAWKQAEEDFQQTFRLKPSLSAPHRDYAITVLFPLGRMKEAEQELHTAIDLDPLLVTFINTLDQILLSDRRFDEVLENSRRVLSSDPNDFPAQQHYARALIQKGKLDEGIAILEKLGKGTESFLGYAYAKAGRRADAERIVAEHTEMPWVQAIVNGGLGNKDQAMEGLEKMDAIMDPRFGLYPYYPELALLRGEPRLNEMRRKAGLPEIH
jgi:TolB-like protein